MQRAGADTRRGLASSVFFPSSAKCVFPGQLRDGRCVCSPGYFGSDCSERDAGEARAAHPHGLRYPSAELTLVMGAPLEQAVVHSGRALLHDLRSFRTDHGRVLLLFEFSGAFESRKANRVRPLGILAGKEAPMARVWMVLRCCGRESGHPGSWPAKWHPWPGVGRVSIIAAPVVARRTIFDDFGFPRTSARAQELQKLFGAQTCRNKRDFPKLSH